MRSNILIVGFWKELNTNVCKQLANELGMFYADVSDLISYEISNSDEMINLCGKEYFDKQENRVIKHMSSFENTIFNINYDYFYNNDNYKYFSLSSHIIYIKVDEEKLNEFVVDNNNVKSWPMAIDVIDYKDRNGFLEQKCELVINEQDTNLCCKKIKDYLKSLYM